MKNIKEFLYLKLEKLREDLKQASNYASGHTTDGGNQKETHFRRFLQDIFPYYDAFKGNVFGKSCDFVLANNREHPRFDSLSTPGFVPHVMPTIVDTIIELKGSFNTKELKIGVEQANVIKSHLQKNIKQAISISSGTRCLDFWTKLTIKHGLIFAQGKFNAKLFFSFLEDHIDFSETSLEKRTTNSKTIFKLNNQEIEAFYKLPDFFYFVEDDTFIQIRKDRVKPDLEFDLLTIIYKWNGILHMVVEIENFYNRNNINQKRYFDLDLGRELERQAFFGIYFKIGEELSWMKDSSEGRSETPEKTTKLCKLLSIKEDIEN